MMNEKAYARNAPRVELSSEFLQFLAEEGGGSDQRLPSIQELAQRLGISTGKLREQLEVARALGFVEVRPKTGIRSQAYAFYPGIRMSLRFALARDRAYFDQFGVLRNHIEASFWHEAVSLLQPEDIRYLQHLVDRAMALLEGDPIQIPHSEHRELHLTIFSRLDNLFVRGLLEAYWDAYEAVGLNVYADIVYLQAVWDYHNRMVEAIVAGDYERGYTALVEHTGLLTNRPELGQAPFLGDEIGQVDGHSEVEGRVTR